MKNTKLSLSDLREKSNTITNTELLNAIKGGELTACHDGVNCSTIKQSVGDEPGVAFPPRKSH